MKPELILSDLIKIDTTNPPGNETAAARYLQGLFAQAGITGEIIEPEPGRGSFIARIGSGSRRLLYLSHFDVVAAGDGWDFDPFGGEIRDGFVLGRGALDCKGLTAAQVAAALQLVREGVALNGELIICAVADEETGGSLGARYLVERYRDKLQADFAVNEGAEQPIFINGKMIYFIQVGEKGTAWCRLHTRGSSCHGSVPTLGDNAVLKMARALTKLEEYRPEVQLIPEVRMLLAELARCRGLEDSFGAAEVDVLLDRLALDRPFTESLRAVTRMTISPNLIAGGVKTNVVPDRCTAELDIRILPGQDRAGVALILRSLIGDAVELEFTQYHEPTFSSSQSSFYRLMADLTRELAGAEAVCLPQISTGATDSRYLRLAGIPAFGIALMARNFDQGARVSVHGRNERIDVESLHLKTRFLKELARRYLS